MGSRFRISRCCNRSPPPNRLQCGDGLTATMWECQAMPECTVCGRNVSTTTSYRCDHCGEYVCQQHLSPDGHDCELVRTSQSRTTGSRPWGSVLSTKQGLLLVLLLALIAIGVGAKPLGVDPTQIIARFESLIHTHTRKYRIVPTVFAGGVVLPMVTPLSAGA